MLNIKMMSLVIISFFFIVSQLTLSSINKEDDVLNYNCDYIENGICVNYLSYSIVDDPLGIFNVEKNCKLNEDGNCDSDSGLSVNREIDFTIDCKLNEDGECAFDYASASSISEWKVKVEDDYFEDCKLNQDGGCDSTSNVSKM